MNVCQNDGNIEYQQQFANRKFGTIIIRSVSNRFEDLQRYQKELCRIKSWGNCAYPFLNFQPLKRLFQVHDPVESRVFYNLCYPFQLVNLQRFIKEKVLDDIMPLVYIYSRLKEGTL